VIYYLLIHDGLVLRILLLFYIKKSTHIDH